MPSKPDPVPWLQFVLTNTEPPRLPAGTYIEALGRTRGTIKGCIRCEPRGAVAYVVDCGKGVRRYVFPFEIKMSRAPAATVLRAVGT